MSSSSSSASPSASAAAAAHANARFPEQRLQQISGHLLAASPTAAGPLPAAPPKANFSAFRASKELEAAIPGPWELADPVYGHLKVLDEHFGTGKAHLLLQEWRGKYGPIFGYYSYEQAHKTLLLRVVLSDPAEVRRILKENPPKAKGYESSIILGHGVLSNANPKEWARQRALLKPAFTTEALKDLLPVMKTGTVGLLKELKGYHERREKLDIHEVLSAFAFLMIGHSALGEADDFLTRRAKALRDAFGVAGLLELNRADVAVNEGYQRAKAEIQDFTTETFRRNEEGQQEAAAKGCPFKKPHSLISIITSKDAEGKPLLNQRQKADQLSTFMFAGHETTAHTMSWAIMELARHPACMKKLQAEIDERLKLCGGLENLTYADLFKFHYLSLVINETLRLWPVVATGTMRQLAEDTVILGITVPKGAVVSFSHYNVHRDKAVWGPNAEEFDPERQWHNDAFLPFTIFPRDCLGRNLAMLEMRMVLIGLFSLYNVHLVDPNRKVQGFNELTLHPEGGVWITLERRS